MISKSARVSPKIIFEMALSVVARAPVRARARRMSWSVGVSVSCMGAGFSVVIFSPPQALSYSVTGGKSAPAARRADCIDSGFIQTPPRSFTVYQQDLTGGAFPSLFRPASETGVKVKVWFGPTAYVLENDLVCDGDGNYCFAAFQIRDLRELRSAVAAWRAGMQQGANNARDAFRSDLLAAILQASRA